MNNNFIVLFSKSKYANASCVFFVKMTYMLNSVILIRIFYIDMSC